MTFVYCEICCYDRSNKNIIFFVFFSFITPNKSNAYSSDPKQFIQEVVDEVKKVLVETNSKEFKTKKREILGISLVKFSIIAFDNNFL